MFKTTIALAASTAALLVAGVAHAATGTVTSDDTFTAYVGSGAGLTNLGSSSTWQSPVALPSFTVNTGDYLYVVAANLYGGPAAWEGVFSTPVGTVVSDTTWVWAPTNDATLTTAELGAIGSWSNAVVATDYYTAQGVSLGSGSQWIWTSAVPTPNNEYYVFRTASPVSSAPVPEPETYAMMVAGLGVLGFLGKRRRKTS